MARQAYIYRINTYDKGENHVMISEITPMNYELKFAVWQDETVIIEYSSFSHIYRMVLKVIDFAS